MSASVRIFQSLVCVLVLSKMILLANEDSFYLLGYYDDRSWQGVIGQGEVNDQVRITFINGILNRADEFMESVAWLSQLHGHVNIHYLCRSTAGVEGDLLRAGLIHFSDWISPEAEQMAILWRQLIQEMGGVTGGGKIIHYAHSLGAADTAMAGRLLNPEERAMIEVICLGSPKVASNTGFGQVKHFASRRDLVAYADIVKYLHSVWYGDDDVIFINDLLGLPLVDHQLRSTYSPILETYANQFVEKYGRVGSS